MKKLIFGILLLIPVTCFGTNPYAQQVVVQQRVVQFDPNYYLGINGYFSHGENLKQKHQEQIAADNDVLLNELQTQNKLLKDILAGLTGKKVEVPTVPVVPPPPAPIDTTPEVEKKVLSIFSANCAKCHGETKSDGGLTLVKNGKLADLSLSQAVIIHHRTNGVSLDLGEGEVVMPKGQSALNDSEVEDIRLWLVNKAKNESQKIIKK